MTVKIIVSRDDVSNALGALVGRLHDKQLMLREIGETLLNSTRQRFISERSPENGAWASLSKSYLSSEKKRKSPNPNAIGRLQGTLSTQLSYVVRENSVEVGSNRAYAAYLQLGTRFEGQSAGHVRLKTDASGKLERSRRGGAVFAKKSDATAEVRGYVTGFYERVQPARPFLGVSAQDSSDIAAIVRDYLTGD